MTDQIAPSLATELEQAAKRLSPECEYSGESAYLVALLTRAAALARAAERAEGVMRNIAARLDSEPGNQVAVNGWLMLADDIRRALVSGKGE